MLVKCVSCLAEYHITDDEDVNLRRSRCSTCGTVGDLFCQHVNCHNGACDECGMEFTDDPYPDDRFEKEH